MSGDTTPIQADAIDFTGGTNTLDLSTGTLSGNVGVDGAGTTLNFDQSANATLANVITGTGAVIDSGLGTLTLSGANTYSGGTRLSTGEIIAGDDSALGSGVLSMLFGTTLGFNGDRTLTNDINLGAVGQSGSSETIAVAQGQADTLSGTIANSTSPDSIPGMVEKTGSGTLTLSAANTYTGGTALNGGTLELGQQTSAGTGPITFGAGDESLRLDSSGTLGASVAGFAFGDSFDLAIVSSAAGASYAGGVLTVSDGANGDQIKIAPAPSGDEYKVSDDGSGHALVSIEAIYVPTITAPANGTQTNNNEPTISGTGEIGDTVELTINGAAVMPPQPIVVGTNGQWSYTPANALADGNYSVTAVETSPSGVGTSGISNAETFTIDTTAPTVAITSPGGPTNEADQTIAGTVDTADAGTTVSVFDNGGTTAIGTGVVQKNGTWTASVTLAQGTNALVAKDTDAAGNTGSSNPVTYALDTTAPTITLDMATPAMGDLGAGKTVTFTLATSEAVTVTGTPMLALNDGGGFATYDAAASTSTSLVFDTTIAAGQNAATLRVTGSYLPNRATIKDAAGNEADLSGAAATFNGLQVDTTAPAAPSPTLTVAQNAGATLISIAAPSDNLTPAAGLAIMAGMLPTDGTVTLADGMTPVTTGEALTSAQLESLEFTPTPGVANQGSTFTYSVTDGAGNAATGTAALDIGGAGAPTLTGTHATMTTAEAPVAPFSGVTVTDPSAGIETLSIVLQNGGGTLTGDGLFVKPDGSYTLSGSAATVTQELDTLSFTPTAPAPGTSATTTFVVSDASSAGTSVSDAGTSVTDTAAAAPPPPPPSNPTPSADTVSIDPNAAFFGRGTFVLTGEASSSAGVVTAQALWLHGAQRRLFVHLDERRIA